MLNIFGKKISWESGLTYFETYFSISNLPKWSRASTKGTYDSFGEKKKEKKKKCVRCKAGGYSLPFFRPLFAETSYVRFVPASDYLGIAFLFHDWKKGEKKGEPSDLTFFETQKVETFFLTFFGPLTYLWIPVVQVKNCFWD